MNFLTRYFPEMVNDLKIRALLACCVPHDNAIDTMKLFVVIKNYASASKKHSTVLIPEHTCSQYPAKD